MKFLAGSFAPDIVSQLRNYAKLMRLDRPIGIWLLLWPTLWALWLAGEGHPDPGLFVVFVVGVIVMRSAGCVLNDYVDRNIDPYVERTRTRPIASGAVMPTEALTLFASLGFIAVGLATMLNRPAQLLAVVAAGLTIAYPFFKRFVSIPQFILGAAFGWTAPMAFAAHTGGTPQLAWLLFGATLVWAVIYDTFYAMVDREDDRKVGVKSTALLFGDMDLHRPARGTRAMVFRLDRRRRGTDGVPPLARARPPARRLLRSLPAQPPHRPGGFRRHIAALRVQPVAAHAVNRRCSTSPVSGSRARGGAARRAVRCNDPTAASRRDG
jgi:4-hydroxybenzoate polyprenyltransferase